MLHGTPDWYKVWKKTDLCFHKWHGESGKFPPEYLKVSKLGLSWHPFVQSWKCMSLKFTGELCFMTMKNDAKIEEELTCQFKTDLRNLTNFHLSTWLKCIMFELKKYRGVMFAGTEYWCKIWRKTACAFKNDMRNLASFHLSTFESLKIGTFTGSFYPN